MAATKPKRGDESKEATLAIKTVRKYHRIGKMALQGYPKGAEPGGGTNARLAEATKVSTALIRQARLFARLYDTEAKLETFLALRSPTGKPLTWKHAQQLIQVDDEAKRTALQALAAQEDWSSSQLLTQVKPLVVDKPTPGAKRRKGGRRFRKAEGPQEVVRKLVELSRRWLKYYDAIGADGGQSILIGIAQAEPGEHDAGFLDQLREAIEFLKKVERAARKAASRLQEAESKAQQHQAGGAKGSRGNPAESVAGPKNRPAR